MIFIQTCSIKINLTLRVLGRRDDGYHNVISAYVKLSSPEVLRITPQQAGEDEVFVHGTAIPGDPKKNILYNACSMLRVHAPSLPPLRIDLYKYLPPGSGIGAGSGNAAALVEWFERSAYAGAGRLDVRTLARLGADVAFLASGGDLLLAEGIGEELSPIGDAPDLTAAIFFPKWRSNTVEAYAAIDRLRTDGAGAMTAADAKEETFSTLRALRAGEKTGLLPNDFISCMSRWESCYNSFYKVLDDCGALAWGLCGSGSSCFGLFRRNEVRKRLAALDTEVTAASGFDWIEQTLVVE